MDHPFIDAKGLTDDQLMDRIQKCQKILASETNMGHNTVVDSARLLLEHYRFEWNERMQARALSDKFKKDERDEEEGPLEFGVVDEYYTPDEDIIKVERHDDKPED